MHISPRMNVMLDCICMRSAKVLVTRNKRKLPIEKFLSTVPRIRILQFFIHNNQNVAVQLIRWTRELVTVMNCDVTVSYYDTFFL